MIRNASLETLVASSAIGGVCSGVVSNTLEVIKTRIMNEALVGKDHHKTGSWKHVSEFRFKCHCYYCFMKNILKKEGVQTLFKGVGYNTVMTVLRSCILFPLYEYSSLKFISSSRI